MSVVYPFGNSGKKGKPTACKCYGVTPIMRKKKPINEENTEAVVGEVLTDEEAKEMKSAIEKRELMPYGMGQTVTKSNELIQRTKYSLPRTEQKLLFLLMSKIDQKHDLDASKSYSISFQEFAKLTGVKMLDQSYSRYLKETVENLGTRSFWVKDEGDGQVYTQVFWLDRGTKIDLDKREVRMKFNPDIWKDIAQLTSNYTSYNIDYLLMMRSTYSMRIYEIILSYDNGNRNYGYNNGLVFEPVNDGMRKKFHDQPDFSDLVEKNKDNKELLEFIAKMSDLSGFKYKKFDMDEFKGLLSAPRKEERKNSSKKKEDEKYNREKPLSEKYKSYGEFQRNILAPVKEEINLLTDIWFDYVPVREKGERKYKYLYIFIKYKSKEEMEFVRAKHDAQMPDTEVIPKTKGRAKKAKAELVEEKQHQQQERKLPAFPENVCSEEWRKKWRSLIGIIKGMAEYVTYEDKLTAEEKNSLNDIFTYTSKILTNEKRRDEAEDMLESLKRISADNDGLGAWALGLCEKLIAIRRKAGEKKSAQYYRTVVYNETTENSAGLIAEGQEKWNKISPERVVKSGFKFDMSVFDEN